MFVVLLPLNVLCASCVFLETVRGQRDCCPSFHLFYHGCRKGFPSRFVFQACFSAANCVGCLRFSDRERNWGSCEERARMIFRLTWYVFCFTSLKYFAQPLSCSGDCVFATFSSVHFFFFSKNACRKGFPSRFVLRE